MSSSTIAAAAAAPVIHRLSRGASSSAARRRTPFRHVSCEATSSSAPPVESSYSRESSIDLKRPMGMVLNSGRNGIGAYVAELVEGGNAELDGSIAVGDALITAGPNGANITNMEFDDIMDILAANPDEPTMALTMKRYAASPNKTKPEGYLWLEGNASKEGVVVLPSGLQYKILETGKGPAGIKTDVRP